jgi:hypothetical protein
MSEIERTAAVILEALSIGPIFVSSEGSEVTRSGGLAHRRGAKSRGPAKLPRPDKFRRGPTNSQLSRLWERFNSLFKGLHPARHVVAHAGQPLERVEGLEVTAERRVIRDG